MEDKVGLEFEGVISGVTNWGIYVELHNTVEGMVNPSSINGDTYIFHENTMMYIGKHTNKMYRLGDIVTIKVEKVSMIEKNITFIFSS
jgi:ribonuclease R